MNKQQQEIQRRLRVLEHAVKMGNKVQRFKYDVRCTISVGGL
jgi:hypothetical protein